MHAVRGIDLVLEPGEVVAFLGPNGAGKTTTIDMILGLSRPTRRSAEVFGMEPRNAIARGLVAAVMQTGGLLKDLSVRETVEYTASLFADTRPVDEVLASAGIATIADRKVAKCSGGEQQRLRFAMALLSDPALLLLDEPTTGMDVEGRRAFWGAIRRDAEQGRTVLFATHYLEEADQYADRIILVSNGRIVADGSGSEVKALAAGRTVRATLRGADAAALSASGEWTPSRSAATSSTCTPRTATRSRATCSRRPTPATWRSSPAGSRKRSSASPGAPDEDEGDP